MNSYESPVSAIGGARSSGAMLDFVVRMLVYYGVLYALYFLIPISIFHDGIYLQVFGRPSAWLIHLMVPAEGITALTKCCSMRERREHSDSTRNTPSRPASPCHHEPM